MNPGRADALDAARPRADARGDRRGGVAAGAPGAGGGRLGRPRPAGRDTEDAVFGDFVAGEGPSQRSRSSCRFAVRRSRRRSRRSPTASAGCRPPLRAHGRGAEDARGDRATAGLDARACPPDRARLAQTARLAPRSSRRQLERLRIARLASYACSSSSGTASSAQRSGARARLELPNALAGDAKLGADLLQRLRHRSVEAEARTQHRRRRGLSVPSAAASSVERSRSDVSTSGPADFVSSTRSP